MAEGMGAAHRAAALLGQSRALVLAPLLLTVLGCESPSASPAATGASSAADPMAAASAMIEQECLRCHAASAIQGKTAADIRNASRKVPSMNRFDGQLTDEQLGALQRVLAREPAKD